MGLLIITRTMGNSWEGGGRADMRLSCLLIVLCVASQGFALLSIFSSLQDKSFLPAKLLFMSERPTTALDSDKTDPLSPASGLLSLLSPL